jgi:hypothetical protein
MRISLVINCDTRAGFLNNESSAEKMFEGCRSVDFLIEGVRNKIKFFEGFDKEVIVFVDEHEIIPQDVMNELRFMVDTVVVRKHDKKFGDIQSYDKFNDLNYLAALQLARGEIICHMDQDASAFTSSPDHVQNLLNLLDSYTYVSYPSHWSPDPVHDPSFNYRWASTRFFLCKREALDFTEIQKCLLSDEYLYGKYPASRKCGWVEHILGLSAKYNGKGVYYPPVEIDKYAIFCWNHYKTGTLKMLNNYSYNEVKDYIVRAGNIQYPNDLKCI